MPFKQITFIRHHLDAKLPTYATDGSAGADIYAVERTMLLPKKVTKVATGLGCNLPPMFEMQVRPRSGLSTKHELLLINSPGTIDADFRGELMVSLYNLGPETYMVEPGDRIAQLVVAPITRGMFFWLETDDRLRPRLVSDPEQESAAAPRGAGGFGSTGR